MIRTMVVSGYCGVVTMSLLVYNYPDYRVIVMSVPEILNSVHFSQRSGPSPSFKSRDQISLVS